MNSNHQKIKHSKSWFSILMAIGTIGVLLILVTSLAISYIRESRLSRYSYDEVIASTAAEGEFEYAMLKARNHRDGFQDATFSGELDGNILDLSTPRSSGLHTQYNIVASSTGQTFSLSGWQHLIVPLFASSGSATLWVTSLSPEFHAWVLTTQNLNISNITWLSWTIVAMSGSESIAITGIGNIGTASQGSIRVKRSQCYSKIDGGTKSCSDLVDWDEEILYTYDNTGSLSDFLRSDGTLDFGTPPNTVKMKITDPYFILYNSTTSFISPEFVSSTPFSLPTLTLTSTATKWESSQVFQFIEDKSRYYDALKYGVYNTP